MAGADDPGPPNTGCGEGKVQIGTRADGSPICAGRDPCGGGKHQEGLNSDGSAKCVPNENRVTGTGTGTETTVNNPDGSTTTTTTEVTHNPNGTTTTKTTVTTRNADGSNTTTTSTSTDGTEDTTEDDPFCQENPDATICQNRAFDGNCQGAFQCDGDPIDCALA